jgi:[acyl-carrier-protein] S-malonyltransferase
MSEFRFIRESHSIAFLFPGQGSQHVGMARALADKYTAAKAVFDEADDILGFALSKLCFEGPEETLTDTIHAQPALLAASVAALRAMESEFGDRRESVAMPRQPSLVAGHSMGEYTALVAAGALSYTHGLRLVRERGRLMKEAGEKNPGMMAAVLGLDEEQVAAICAEATAQKGIAQVANDNCPGQVVISGDHKGMETAMAALTAAGARKVVPLAVSIAAHSPLMAPAAEELRAVIEATPFASPQAPVIGNMSAELLTTVEAIRAELVAQLTGSVRWTASIQRALAIGVNDFVEVGPGDVLVGLARRIERKANRLTVNDPASVKAFVQWFVAR